MSLTPEDVIEARLEPRPATASAFNLAGGSR